MGTGPNDEFPRAGEMGEGVEAAEAADGGARSPRLTRRELLGAAAAGTAAVAVAGCAPLFGGSSSHATPFALGRPATVAFDATVPAALRPALLKLLTNVAGVPSAAEAGAGQAADLAVTYGAPPTGYSGAAVGASALAVFTHMRVPVDGVTRDQALKLLGGQATDWKQVGAPYGLPVRVFALEGLPLPSGVVVAAGAKTSGTPEDLLAALRGQPGSVAVAPVEAADWRVRNLGVDNVYPAQGRGDAANGGLPPLTLQVGASRALASKGLDVKALAAALKPALAASATTIDMAAAGDIMLGRGVNNKMIAHGDYSYPYKGLHDELQAADFRVANLECTITDLVKPPSDPFTFYFLSAKKAVEGLAYAGFNAITIANNHAGGTGAGSRADHDSFFDMLGTLRANNIAVCGGGNNLAEARAPIVTTVKGTRIALLGYHDNTVVTPQGPMARDASWGLAPANPATLPEDIAAARAKADLVIPYFHWGIEYTKVPHKRQQQVARAAIDAGADMVLGNHPHWTQGIEEYKGKLIIYSMGNFVFDQDWSRPTLEGMLIHFYWRGATLASVRFVPTIDRDRCQPNAMSQADAVGVFQRMWSGTDLLAAGQYGIA